MHFPTASTADAKGFICWLMMQCSIPSWAQCMMPTLHALGSEWQFETHYGGSLPFKSYSSAFGYRKFIIHLLPIESTFGRVKGPMAHRHSATLCFFENLFIWLYTKNGCPFLCVQQICLFMRLSSTLFILKCK